MAYVELKVGSIIVYPSSLEVVTSIVRAKSKELDYKVARTKLLHQNSKGATHSYYWSAMGDKNSYYIREGQVVNLTAEELAKVRGDLNMLSKLLPKVLHINGIFSHIVDNKIPELIEEMKSKLDLRMEVRRIIEDSICKNYRLKHIYKSTRLNPELRPMVSVLAELLLIPGATKDSIDATMTMNFGVDVFNVGVNV
jgi:hypothetical protein